MFTFEGQTLLKANQRQRETKIGGRSFHKYLRLCLCQWVRKANRAWSWNLCLGCCKVGHICVCPTGWNKLVTFMFGFDVQSCLRMPSVYFECVWNGKLCVNKLVRRYFLSLTSPLGGWELRLSLYEFLAECFLLETEVCFVISIEVGRSQILSHELSFLTVWAQYHRSIWLGIWPGCQRELSSPTSCRPQH